LLKDPLKAQVSVAIPCYNGEAYVGQTVESVLAQSRAADEVLVIDDGSTDQSVKIIQRYPVRLVQHEKNRGLAYARNTAIENASGDILVFVDVDALADPQMLATLEAGYDSPDVGGVGGQGIEANIHSLADRWRRAHASQGHGRVPKDVEFLFGLCMSFRLYVLRQVGGFNAVFRTNAEDMDIGMRVNAAGYRLRYLPGAKVYHQRTDDVESMKRTMATWYSASYRARYVNKNQPWRMYAGSLRRLFVDTLSDLIAERDVALARLSWQMGWIKLRAVWQEAKRCQSKN
jgi:glycosyltransferase involved in cell wall biosynthesis